MKIALIQLSILLFLFIGCSTYHQSFYGTGTSTPNYYLDVEKISDNEVSGEAYSGYLFGFIKVSGESEFAEGITYGNADTGDYADLKSAAAYNAIKKSGCSILIAPRYVVMKSNSLFYRSVTVKVYGYPGRYTNLIKVE